MSDVRIIVEVDELSNFPENGREDVYYFAILEGVFYRYDGATYIALSSGAGAVLSVSGTTDRITSTGGTHPIIDLSATLESKLDLFQKTTANTGIISGGALTINADPTKFDISAGKGFIIDHSVSPPTTTIVEWTAFTAQVVANLLTSFATEIAINSAGAIVQQNAFTNTELRSLILLGGLDHSNNINILNKFEIQVPSEAVGSSLKELSKAIGDINISGNVFSPNGANLKINKSSGTAFKFGANNVSTPNDPHTISQALLTQADFNYVYDDGAGNGIFQSLTSDINPTNYDDGSGILASVSGNNFTIQRLLLFPNANKVFIQYGTQSYNNLATAISNLSTQNYVALNGIRTATVRGYLIVRANATALNNPSQALFVQSDRFGGIGARDGGGGVVEWGNIIGTLSNQIDLANLPNNCIIKDNSGISHTGTTAETLIFSQLIPAGTLEASDIFRFNIMFGLNTNNANVKTARVYFNTTNDLLGTPIIVATRTLTSAINGNCLRNLFLKNSLTIQDIGIPTSNFVSDENVSNVSISTINIDFSVDQYFILSAQLANSADTMGVRSIMAQILR